MSKTAAELLRDAMDHIKMALSDIDEYDPEDGWLLIRVDLYKAADAIGYAQGLIVESSGLTNSEVTNDV